MGELKTIMLDLDDTTSFGGFLYCINQFLGTNYKITDFKSYYMQEVIPEELRDEFFEQLKTKNIYEGSVMMPHAKRVIELLNDAYNLHFVSSFIIPELGRYSALFVPQKMDFIMDNMPFIDPGKISFTSQKTMMGFDIGIDDLPANLKGAKQKILMKTYHNQNIPKKDLKEQGIEMAKDWLDIEKKLL